MRRWKIEEGYCLRQVQGKGLTSLKVTFDQSPEGSKGVSYVGIWGRVLWGQGASSTKILGLCRDQHTRGQCGWNRVSEEESGQTLRAPLAKVGI